MVFSRLPIGDFTYGGASKYITLSFRIQMLLAIREIIAFHIHGTQVKELLIRVVPLHPGTAKHEHNIKTKTNILSKE